jgi:hypothetical protein
MTLSHLENVKGVGGGGAGLSVITMLNSLDVSPNKEVENFCYCFN